MLFILFVWFKFVILIILSKNYNLYGNVTNNLIFGDEFIKSSLSVASSVTKICIRRNDNRLPQFYDENA